MNNLKNIRISIVVFGGLLLFIFHSSQVQELILQFGEKLKGTELRDPNKWYILIELISFAIVLVLLPFSFNINNQLKSFYLVKDVDFKDYFLAFPNFVYQNIPLLVLVTIATLTIHGIKLGEQVIPIDTEIWLDDRAMNWKEIGRFSLILLQGLTTLMGQNHWAVNFFTILFSIIGTLTWCYLLHVVTGVKNKPPYFVFALVYSVSPIWIDILYFTCLSLEVSLGMALTPFVIYLLFISLMKKQSLVIFLCCLLLIFFTGMYQSFIVVFCSGLLICYFCFCVSEKNTIRDKQLVLFNGVICFIASIIGYFIIENIAQKYIFNVISSDYLSSQARLSLLDLFSAIPSYLHRLLTDWPMEFFLICLIFPYVLIKELFTKETWLKKISLLFLIMTMFAFPLVTGGGASFRIQLMEPVVVGFVAFLFFVRLGREMKIVKGVFLTICLFQLFSGSMVNYTDYLRYQQDKILAYDIHRELQQQGSGDLPVIFYGKYTPQYNVDYKISEVSGHSIFEWTDKKDPKDSTGRGLLFMKALGYNYESTDDEILIQKARSVAETMNDYPQPGFIQNLGDVVVVRLSETSYNPEPE